MAQMSRGILPLAATGKLPLQLEYRELANTQQAFSAETEAFELFDQSNMPFMTGAFDVAYGEY